MNTKPILIALPTTKTQSATRVSSEDNLVAVTVISPERAKDILGLMKSVTRLARKHVGVYKLSSFDGNTYYVPASAVQPAPEENDFRVLEPGFKPKLVAKLINFQIGIIPGAVIWEAFDAENRFLVTTGELPAEALEAIANGVILNPGTTGEDLNNALPDQLIVDDDPRWRMSVM